MAVSIMSADKLREARKSGFKKKAPKKPKKTASVSTMENYLQRVKEFNKEAQAAINSTKKRIALRKKIHGV
jgi:hypothetical protein